MPRRPSSILILFPEASIPQFRIHNRLYCQQSNLSLVRSSKVFFILTKVLYLGQPSLCILDTSNPTDTGAKYGYSPKPITMLRFLSAMLLPLVLLLLTLPHRSTAHYLVTTAATGTAPVPTGTGTGTAPLPTGTYGYAYAGYARDVRIVKVKRGEGAGWE